MIRLRAMRFLKIGEPEIKWLDRLVDSNKAALDIGANLGVYTYFLRKFAQEVHAFEPNPDLQRNLQATFGNSITLHPCALSSEEGTADLSFPILNGTRYHGWGSLEKSFSEETEVVSYQVPLKVLDKQELPPVGFIKIDVEGHESAVLEGARKLITKDLPKLLIEIEEQHAGDNYWKTFEILESLGYRASYLYEDSFVPLKTGENGKHELLRETNMFLFIPKEAPLPK